MILWPTFADSFLRLDVRCTYLIVDEYELRFNDTELGYFVSTKTTF